MEFQLAPLILAAITGGIKLAEILFGPKTGPAKKQFVTDAVTSVTDQFLTAGNIKEKVSPELLSLAIDLAVHVMNSAGFFKTTNAEGVPVVSPISDAARSRLRAIFLDLAENL